MEDVVEHRHKLIRGALEQFRANGLACILVPPGGIGDPDTVAEVAKQVLQAAALMGGFQAPVIQKTFQHDVVAWTGYLREAYPDIHEGV